MITSLRQFIFKLILEMWFFFFELFLFHFLANRSQYDF